MKFWNISRSKFRRSKFWPPPVTRGPVIRFFYFILFHFFKNSSFCFFLFILTLKLFDNFSNLILFLFKNYSTFERSLIFKYETSEIYSVRTFDPHPNFWNFLCRLRIGLLSSGISTVKINYNIFRIKSQSTSIKNPRYNL